MLLLPSAAPGPASIVLTNAPLPPPPQGLLSEEGDPCVLVDEERNTFSLGTAIADLRDRVSRDFIPPFTGDKVRSSGGGHDIGRAHA
jgi:hypothetical protein